MRVCVLCAALVFVTAGAALAQEAARPERADDDALRRVVVTAEGYTKDDALQQALRKALEKGAGTEIASHSEVRDFVLVRDTIYSRAAGIVSEYTVLEGPEEIAGGAWSIKIEALVRPDAVARAWGEVQNLLDQIGRPKIMVWVDERIDGRLQDASIVESRIEQLFLEQGFELVDRAATEAIRRREARDAEDTNDTAKLARLAKDAGAHILIRGSAEANRAGLRDIYGVTAAFYNCSAQAKIYYTDTGQLLVSESIPTRDRGVRSYHEFSPQAARQALVAATFPDSPRRREPALATRLLDSVMRQWSTIITAGGTIELAIDRLDFKTFVQLKRALGELERVQSVNADFSKNTGLFRLKSQVSAQTLAEQLIEDPFDDWIEVLDLKPNRIQARAVSRPATRPG